MIGGVGQNPQLRQIHNTGKIEEIKKELGLEKEKSGVGEKKKRLEAFKNLRNKFEQERVVSTQNDLTKKKILIGEGSKIETEKNLDEVESWGEETTRKKEDNWFNGGVFKDLKKKKLEKREECSALFRVGKKNGETQQLSNNSVKIGAHDARKIQTFTNVVETAHSNPGNWLKKLGDDLTGTSGRPVQTAVASQVLRRGGGKILLLGPETV